MRKTASPRPAAHISRSQAVFYPATASTITVNPKTPSRRSNSHLLKRPLLRPLLEESAPNASRSLYRHTCKSRSSNHSTPYSPWMETTPYARHALDYALADRTPAHSLIPPPCIWLKTNPAVTPSPRCIAGPLPSVALRLRHPFTMPPCDTPSVASVSAADYAKMPATIDSEDPLLNVGKKELQQALSMAHNHVWVAEWLFADSAHIFHRKTAAIPPEAFDNSLAIHLRNEISTPPQCPQPRRDVLAQPSPTERAKVNSQADAYTVRKEIDLLLVPVVNVNGITAGYSFLNGVQEAATGPVGGNSGFDSHGAAQHGGQFIAGRFSFDNARRDFLMVVNSMYPHMTGIVSMRWRDAKSRERSFFAIPKADYGPGNLPSRVLSVQCNVDFVLDTQEEPQYQFRQDMTPTPSSNATFSYLPGTPSFSTTSSASDEAAMTMNECCRDDGDEVPEPIERDFTNIGDVEEDAVVPGGDHMEGGEDSWFRLGADGSFGSWGEGLESIGTVIAPGDDPDGVIPEILQDFAASRQYMDDVDRILGEEDDLSRSNSSGEHSSDGSEGPLSSQKRRKETVDLHSFSPIESTLSPPQSVRGDDLDFGLGPGLSAEDPSWIFSTSTGTTPDGVGVPRRPGKNNTSSGAFDMGTLLGSLATIERSLKGHFYGPKVRKDILHPLTGELISRCTGEVNARLDTVDPISLSLLRSVAAQSYYASLLAVSNDTRLIASQPASGPFFVSQGKVRSPTDEPKRKQGRTEPQKRPAPAPLAPRPVPTIALPPGLPHPEVLQIPDAAAVPGAGASAPLDEEAAREAKLEAKRVKNRISAAKSNQKRRAQLEAQRKELAALRERVAELKSKQLVMTQENESLKRQIISRS